MTINSKYTVRARVLGGLVLLVLGAHLYRTLSSGKRLAVEATGMVSELPERAQTLSAPMREHQQTSTSYDVSTVFENLVAVWPSAEAIRAASMDRFTSFVHRVKPNLANDLHASEAFSSSFKVWIPTSNPQPIFMLTSEASVFQLDWQRSRAAEGNIRRLFREILGSEKFGCSKHVGDGLVLDVGANEGFYGLLSSSYGCRTISFEPQPTCLAWLSYAVAINNFKHPLKVLQKVASSDESSKFTVPIKGCSGVQQYVGKPGEVPQSMEVGAISLDRVITENESDVLLLHMDVEGAEINVLKSALASFEQGLIKNFVFEMNPSRWATFGVEPRMTGITFLEKLMKFGYVCRDLEAHGLQHPVQSIEPISSFSSMNYNSMSETDVWCTSIPELKPTKPKSTAAYPGDQQLRGHLSVDVGKASNLPDSAP